MRLVGDEILEYLIKSNGFNEFLAHVVFDSFPFRPADLDCVAFQLVAKPVHYYNKLIAQILTKNKSFISGSNAKYCEPWQIIS